MELKKYCYEYPRPAVTADIVVFGYAGGTLRVLLVKRKNEPYRGCWAFPGGFMNMDEDAETCARRELQEETGLQGIALEQLYTFSAVGRDPRGRTVSVAYLAVADRTSHTVQGADDAADARWFALSDLPELAFDHREILEKAWQRIRDEYIRFSAGGRLFPRPETIGFRT